MIFGFTGTHHGMTDAQKAGVRNLLWLEIGHIILEFHEGDCIGSDAQATDIAWSLGYDVSQHPPTNPRNRFDWRPPAPVREGQKFFLHPEFSYMARDHHIVQSSRRMIATPAGFVEELRSGTWATIRYARKKKVPISIVWPDGSVKHEGFDSGPAIGASTPDEASSQ